MDEVDRRDFERMRRDEERRAMAVLSAFGNTPVETIAERLPDYVTVEFPLGGSPDSPRPEENRQRRGDVHLTRDEFVAVIEACFYGKPDEHFDPMRALHTVEARLKILDALGIDERSPLPSDEEESGARERGSS